MSAFFNTNVFISIVSFFNLVYQFTVKLLKQSMLLFLSFYHVFHVVNALFRERALDKLS